jgi:hypothetical protein
LYLGETSTPRRWNGRYVFNLDAGNMALGTLDSARIPQVFLLDGSRKLTGNVKFTYQGSDAPQIKAISTDLLAIRNTNDDTFYHLAMGQCIVYAYIMLNCGFVYHGATDTYYKVLDGNDTLQTVLRMQGAGYPYTYPDYFVELVRAGDINVVDDKFIRVGKSSTGTLPTPDASYRGKLLRVEDNGGDKLYICEWNGSAYAWRQI